jgi:hypothetical protein
LTEPTGTICNTLQQPKRKPLVSYRFIVERPGPSGGILLT